MGQPRYLLITADDFGIGPDTSRGILDLARLGAVTSTVLLANSPHAAEAVTLWRRAGRPVELGWHPCLTLDAPVLPPGEVPSLVRPDGRFLPLGRLLQRLAVGRVDRDDVAREFRAQLARYRDLTGQWPANVNAHHHVHVFRPVGDALAAVLRPVTPRPFVRRVTEGGGSLRRVPGARVKRLTLSAFGRRAARRQAAAGLPGNAAVLGVTDPPFVHAPDFFARWLRAAAGGTGLVELTCHPGHLDATLDGRDGSLADGQLHRRAREFQALRDPAFLRHVEDQGFTLTTAADWVAGGRTRPLTAAVPTAPSPPHPAGPAPA